jgi:hypothetical protein
LVLFLNSRQGGDGGERIIKNDMILWGDVLCPWIEDERDQARVPGRETNKYPLAGATFPLGYLLTILKTRVKQIHRIPKDIGTGKTGAGSFNPGEQFFR